MKKLSLISGLIFSFLFLYRGNCKGQEEYNFLPEKEAYIEELIRFFDKYGNQRSKEFLNEFFDYTSKTELEENEWMNIAEISNQLTARQFNPYSYMAAFIDAVSSFKFNPKRNSNFPVWSQRIYHILQQEKKELEQVVSFCTFTSNLHRENILFSSRAMKWKISLPDYSFGNGNDFFIQTGRINLVGSAGRDSSRIQSTRGKFYPSSNSWQARGGKISWERVGLDNDLVYVDLQDYNIDLSRSVYSLDSVNLIDKRHFDHPIPGKFEDKIVTGVRPERSGYPRFSSYQIDNRIKSIFPGMDYKGGYSLEGLKIVGSGL